MARVDRAQPAATGKSLRDLAQERQTLDEFIAEHEGELTPEIAALLTEHEGDARVKAERIGQYLMDEEAAIAAEKAEIKRRRDRLAAREKRVDWFTNRYVAEQMLAMGMGPGDKLVGVGVTIGLQLNNPRLDGAPENPSVQYDDTDQANLERWFRAGMPFMRERTVYSFDRQRALQAFKNAETLDLPHDRAAVEALKAQGVKAVRDISVRVK